MPPLIVLASASPQRQQLLAGLGVAFSAVPSAVEESECTEQAPAKRAVALAGMKARAVAASHPDAYVIGCDTLVVASDATLLEKPLSEEDARSMLRRQSATASVVHSGLCIAAPGGKTAEGLSSSVVLFKKLSKRDIDWWIRTGLWNDRSGGFQIDGLGQLLISRLEGDWTGVVGLPVFLLGELLTSLGQELLSFRS